jgi:hypothetical protein|tara:strand:- start:92 stop:508 length:417 start_codon:yes stop_codon:yes gene_type:complete
MTEKKNKTPIESLSGYGGVRALQKKLERSTTVAANREAVAHSLLCIANATVMDVMSWDENGVFVKNSADISAHAAQAIKKVRFTPDGKVIDIEFHDKPAILRLLAKASGMLDIADQSDRPSVIGINVKAPDIIDNDES